MLYIPQNALKLTSTNICKLYSHTHSPASVRVIFQRSHSSHQFAAVHPCPPSLIFFRTMATLQYVEIPSSATRLESTEPSEDIRPAPKIVTNLPHPEKAVGHLTTSTTAQPHSPTGTKNASSGFNFQQILLSSALPIPANAPTSPRAPAGKGIPKLLTTRDPLSIPITTVNFRRFVAKMGPYFWFMDRAEEIILWKKGWQYTAVWMSVYAFICVFL